MTIEAGGLAADRARVQILRRRLGARLATCRMAAGVSQPQLGQALGRTRSTVSKIEHGTRGLPVTLWMIADEVCRAQGVLIAEHSELAQAEQDYRAWCRLRDRQVQQQAAQAQAESFTASPTLPASPVLLSGAVPQPDRLGGDGWPGMALVHGELAGELMAMITRLVRAVEAPGRLDGKVINNLAATLAHCKRQEDQLGPYEVLDTVVAQHGLVHRLLEGGSAQQLHKPLSLVDSNMASAIGGYLIDMGQPEAATRYFGHARKAAHDAGNPACAAYAAANASFAARLRGDTPTAVDTGAAARSLAARTDDARLQALAEQMAAAAYALDGRYGPCMAACARAHDLLTNANGSPPDSLAYWVDHGVIDSQFSTFLVMLDRPEQAVEAASNAHAQYDRTRVGGYALCEVRLGTALVLSKEITEAARVLGDAASQAHLFPRLEADLHTARTLMQPWHNTPAVQTLDAQLQACGLRHVKPHV